MILTFFSYFFMSERMRLYSDLQVSFARLMLMTQRHTFRNHCCSFLLDMRYSIHSIQTHFLVNYSWSQLELPVTSNPDFSTVMTWGKSLQFVGLHFLLISELNPLQVFLLPSINGSAYAQCALGCSVLLAITPGTLMMFLPFIEQVLVL